MNRNVLFGVVAAVTVVGTGYIIVSGPMRIGDIFASLQGVSPRLMGVLVLPFIVVLIVVGNFLRKKNEERKWKNALLKTRAGKQKEAARKAARENPSD